MVSIAIHTKVGKFLLTPGEWENLRQMTQSQIMEFVKKEFDELSESEVVYVTNHIQIKLMAEADLYLPIVP